MSRLISPQYRIVVSDDGRTATLTFRTGSRQVDIDVHPTALSAIAAAIASAARETHLPLSQRQTTGFRSVKKIDLRPEQEQPAIGTAPMSYGVAVTADLSLVVPYFSVPNESGEGASQWTMALPPEAAERLMNDLQRALSLIRKPTGERPN